MFDGLKHLSCDRLVPSDDFSVVWRGTELPARCVGVRTSRIGRIAAVCAHAGAAGAVSSTIKSSKRLAARVRAVATLKLLQLGLESSHALDTPGQRPRKTCISTQRQIGSQNSFDLINETSLLSCPKQDRPAAAMPHWQRSRVH